MKTIAVIPAYNEELTVGSIVSLSLKHVDEVILVDDGSDDNTAWIAQKAGARVLSTKNNRGKGAALKIGFDKALDVGAKFIIMLDSDGEHHPRDIPHLLKPVKNGKCDISVGVRYKKGRGETPFYRRFGQKLLDAETNIIAKTNFTDTQSGFRCLTRDALMKVNTDYTGFEVESLMLIKAIENHLRIKEVPIDAEYRKYTPVMSPVSHGIRVVLSLIELIGKKHILLSFGIGSIGSFILSVLFTFRVFDLFSQNRQWPYGTILLATMFFLIGVYMSTTGLTLFMINELKTEELSKASKTQVVNMKIKKN
ncbi:glycosyltransferase family 2 protein [Candidatus Altiarchaeota archaeon]